MENPKTEPLCDNREFRNSMSNWTLLLVSFLIIMSWVLIYNGGKEVRDKVVKQTAIAQSFAESGTATIVLDRDAKVLYWDENAVKLFGFTSLEVVSKSIDIVVPHGREHKELVGDFLDRQEVGVKIIMCEGQTKEGKIIPLSLRVQPKGKEKQVLVFADLITETTYTER